MARALLELALHSGPPGLDRRRHVVSVGSDVGPHASSGKRYDAKWSARLGQGRVCGGKGGKSVPVFYEGYCSKDEKGPERTDHRCGKLVRALLCRNIGKGYKNSD